MAPWNDGIRPEDGQEEFYECAEQEEDDDVGRVALYAQLRVGV